MSNSICTATSASALAVLIALAGGAAQAKELAPETTPPTSAGAVDEIIVTAQKRTESLQSVPIAISAISSADLRARGVSDFRALAAQVPNLVYGEHDGSTFITIRGVGSSVDTGVTEPSVATYIDGIFIPRSTMGSLQQQDLERVEVLRGPQGTLYGRNATGGAVNFISAKPTEELSTGLTLQTGNYARYGVNGYVSGGLVDGITARLSGGFEKRDGYVKNVVNGQALANVDRWNIRGAIRFEPSTTFSNDLSVQYLRDNGRNAYQQQLALAISPLIPASATQAAEAWQIAGEKQASNRARTLLVSNIADLELSDTVSLRSLTGYIDHNIVSTFDGDGTSYALVNVENWVRPSKSFTQELNLSGKTGSLDWLLGAYYFHENFFTELPAVLPSGIPGALPAGAVSINRLSEKTRSFALFANGTWSLASSLRLLGGMRYNTERKSFLQSLGAIIPPFVGVSDLATESKVDKFLPKIGLQYDFSQHVTGYAQYQKGYKSGGRNIGTLTFYRPESLNAYEIGLKTTFANGAATFNAAAFHYDYKDLQVLKVIGGTTTQVENGDARINGLEAELQAHPVRNLRFNAAASWLDAKYTSFSSIDPADPTGALQNLTGNRLNRSPQFSMSAGIEPTIPLGDGFVEKLVLRGELFHSSQQYYLAYNKAQDAQPAFTKVNLSARLESADGQYSLRAFVNNLTNAKVKSHILFSPLSGLVGNYEPPRLWGLELSIRR